MVRRGAARTHPLHMVHEIDLPCSDCGTELVERTVNSHELVRTTAIGGQVTLAECPACGARYYPRETLTLLFGASDSSHQLGDS